MKYRPLGKSGLQVSEIGMGCWAIGGAVDVRGEPAGWGRTDDAISLRTLTEARDRGINFFDTADSYGCGHSEELVGKAFSGNRDEVIIATKGGNRVIPGEGWRKDFSPEWISQAIDASLRRLGTDYIDVYQIHSPAAGWKYTDELVAALERAREAGKIRFYGVSVSNVPQGLDILNGGRRCDVFQVVHNILERRAEERLFPASQKAGIGIITRVPLQSGFLTGKFSADTAFPPNDHRSLRNPPEVVREKVAKVERLRPVAEARGTSLARLALLYCLSPQAVSVVIPGAKTPEQIADNVAASDEAPLTEEEISRIRRAADSAS